MKDTLKEITIIILIIAVIYLSAIDYISPTPTNQSYNSSQNKIDSLVIDNFFLHQKVDSLNSKLIIAAKNTELLRVHYKTLKNKHIIITKLNTNEDFNKLIDSLYIKYESEQR